jgi:hypothetical protein
MAARAGIRYIVTLATRAEQNRCQVGPTIHFDRPRQEPPPFASFVSQLGRARALCDGSLRTPLKKEKVRITRDHRAIGLRENSTFSATH